MITETFGLNPELLALYYGFPQRFIAGLPTEETPLVYTPSQRTKTALEYLTNTTGVNSPFPITQDGKASVAVGTTPSGIQARVYRPTTEEQATRNLNFAIANLQAYVDWDQTGRAEQARIEKQREENLRKAEAEAAKKRLEETRLKNGLDLYNKVNGTRHLTWGYTHIGNPFTREKWAKQAEELATLQRSSNPYISNIFGGNIASGSIISASRINDYFRL